MEETAYTLPFPKRNCGEKETTNYGSKYWTLRAGIFEMLLQNRSSQENNCFKVELWSNFYPLTFWVYNIEFHERITTPFMVCKYLHWFWRYLSLGKICNEFTDDVIHSTQCYIEYMNRAILANLQCRTLKFGRLIVLQETHVWL